MFVFVWFGLFSFMLKCKKECAAGIVNCRFFFIYQYFVIFNRGVYSLGVRLIDEWWNAFCRSYLSTNRKLRRQVYIPHTVDIFSFFLSRTDEHVCVDLRQYENRSTYVNSSTQMVHLLWIQYGDSTCKHFSITICNWSGNKLWIDGNVSVISPLSKTQQKNSKNKMKMEVSILHLLIWLVALCCAICGLCKTKGTSANLKCLGTRHHSMCARKCRKMCARICWLCWHPRASRCPSATVWLL